MRKLKCTVNDFTELNLPGTRKQVFSDCYKEHFSVIFRIGLLCMLFFIPILVVTFMRDVYLINAIESLEEQTTEKLTAVYYSANAIYGFANLFAFTLFATLLSGVVRVIRQLLWGEPLFFRDDFKNGVKSDALRFAVTALIISLLNYILNLLDNSIITYVLYGTFIAVVLPIAMWTLLQSVYYSLKLSATVKNAAIYYIRTFPATLLLIACTAVPFWLVGVIPIIAVKYMALILMAVFFVPPLTMVWILYACHTFDKYINKEHYPSIYRKGMRPEEESEQNCLVNTNNSEEQ